MHRGADLATARSESKLRLAADSSTGYWLAPIIQSNPLDLARS